MENAVTKPEWSFADDNEALIGIETKKYDNDNIVKRCRLSDGKEAIVREITGADSIEADKVAGGKQENTFPAMMAVATKIDGKPITMEDLLVMKAKDFNKIKAMVAALNF